MYSTRPGGLARRTRQPAFHSIKYVVGKQRNLAAPPAGQEGIVIGSTKGLFATRTGEHLAGRQSTAYSHFKVALLTKKTRPTETVWSSRLCFEPATGFQHSWRLSGTEVVFSKNRSEVGSVAERDSSCTMPSPYAFWDATCA